MDNLNKSETELKGKWLFENNKIVADETVKRIQYLIEKCLIKIKTDKSGWETLYQDPNDKRYWEFVYLQSESQGGGPPSLINISKEIAIEKYGI